MLSGHGETNGSREYFLFIFARLCTIVWNKESGDILKSFGILNLLRSVACVWLYSVWMGSHRRSMAILSWMIEDVIVGMDKVQWAHNDDHNIISLVLAGPDRSLRRRLRLWKHDGIVNHHCSLPLLYLSST